MIKQQSPLLELFAPSWLSGLIAIVVGLTVTGGVIIAFASHDNGFQQQLISWQHDNSQHRLTTPDQELEENDRPTLKGSWPLMLIWSFVGFVVYAITMTIIGWGSKAKELHDSMDYVNAHPHQQLIDAAEHLVLRIVSAAIFIGLAVIFFNRVVPYSITAAHASAVDAASLVGIVYGVLSFLIIVVSIYIETIFLRLSFGKVRVFQSV